LEGLSLSNNLFTGGTPILNATRDAELIDPVLQDLLANYKKRIAGNYRPLTADDILTLPNGPMWVSRKLDGELWFLIAQDGYLFLSNPNGRVIHGEVPFLSEAKVLPDQTIMAGELHVFNDEKRERVGDLSALLGGESKEDLSRLVFSAFDLVKQEAAVPADYELRYERLKELLAKASFPLEVLISDVITSPSDLKQRYQQIVEDAGAEGLVVRQKGGMIYKIKPSIDLDVVVFAYTVKTDEPELVRSILLGLMHEDGTIQLLGGCGNVGSTEDRKSLLKSLEKIKADSSVRYASESGALYTFVKPEIVIELKVTDLQSERSDASLTKTPLLKFDNEKWSSLGLRPCPRPIHPVMVRVRTDKGVNPSDVRFSQLINYLAPEANKPNKEIHYPASTLIKRMVWTKE
jgi:ATP-dependent DNA ligase